MSPRRLIVAACVAWLAVVACADSRVAEIRTRAQAWVDRLHDSAAADTAAADTLAADTLAAGIPDSAQLDAWARAWTPEDWVRFWEEVEREEARRR
jgi:hypothetical protein